MANVYQKYMGSIIRSEYKCFYPVSTQNFNAQNKKTDFNIDYGDGFSMALFQYYISGTLKKADGTEYTATENVKLTDNFIPYLFSKIEVKKHNYILDEVEYPGVTSTVKSIVSYESSDENALKNCGFITSAAAADGKKTFYVCGNLSHLGLGFFEDVKIPIYKGGFIISFIRDDDTHTVYRWKTKRTDGTYDAASLPVEGKVTINEFIIRVPMVEFKPTSKIELVKDLVDQEKLNFHFRQWQFIQKPGLSGNTCTFDVTNIFRNVQSPTFVMVDFQSVADQQNNSSLFAATNVKNIRVYINDNAYPHGEKSRDGYPFPPTDVPLSVALPSKVFVRISNRRHVVTSVIIRHAPLEMILTDVPTFRQIRSVSVGIVHSVTSSRTSVSITEHCYVHLPSDIPIHYVSLR